MRIAFLGDSLTEGLPGESYFERVAAALPGHILLNWGRAGDTVVSLAQRLDRLVFDPRPDAVFLWVGVNDVILMESPYYLTGVNPDEADCLSTEEEFAGWYRQVLDYLAVRTGRVVAVGPLFCGEDLNDSLNQRLAGLSETIRRLCHDYPNATFVDMRREFFADPATAPVLPACNGLRFTTDGVHLNAVGADVVARVMLRQIARLDW